jgi:CDP-diglyceride synthetase
VVSKEFLKSNWWKFLIFILLGLVSFALLYPWFAYMGGGPGLFATVVSLLFDWPMVLGAYLETLTPGKTALGLVLVIIFLIVQIFYTYLVSCWVFSLIRKLSKKRLEPNPAP